MSLGSILSHQSRWSVLSYQSDGAVLSSRRRDAPMRWGPVFAAMVTASCAFVVYERERRCSAAHRSR
jgi:hypothetical protein